MRVTVHRALYTPGLETQARKPMYGALSDNCLVTELYDWMNPPPEYSRPKIGSIDPELIRRLRQLKFAASYPYGNKVCEQLRGREAELVSFWRLRQLLEHNFGYPPSDYQAAGWFQYILDRPCSREQARRRRKLIERLEAMPEVWGRVTQPRANRSYYH